LIALREAVLALLRARFPGLVSSEIVATINAQPSADLLTDWNTQAGTVLTIDDFRAYLRR
jgi:hypothetical protein